MFELHPRLATDTFLLGRLTLCQVLLMDDASYPWLVLVPEREDISEIHQLGEEDRRFLIDEIAFTSLRLQQEFGAHKMNVAALGNVVPQLHVHLVARLRGDPAWPGPVWGHASPQPYGSREALSVTARIRAALAPLLASGVSLESS